MLEIDQRGTLARPSAFRALRAFGRMDANDRGMREAGLPPASRGSYCSSDPGLGCLGGKVSPSGLCPSVGAARLAERERAGKVVVRDAGLACGLRG